MAVLGQSTTAGRPSRLAASRPIRVLPPPGGTTRFVALPAPAIAPGIVLTGRPSHCIGRLIRRTALVGGGRLVRHVMLHGLVAPGASPGPGWRAVVAAVTVENLGPVLVPGGGGAVGVQHDGPAVAVDLHLVVEPAEQRAVPDGGLAAVGLMGQVVDLAPGGGLVAAAGEPAVLVPLDHRPADRGRDVGADADVQGQAAAAQPGAELAAAQEGRQAAGPGEQGDGLGDDLLLQDVLDVPGVLDAGGIGGGAVAAEPVQVGAPAGPGHPA